jgi:zinc-binding alcohol dehydrogenase family protein
MTMMKAVGLYKYLPIDNPESLLDVEVDTPVATGRDLLVEVKAISVNPVDTKRRAPKDLVEKTPKILGWDAAGVVVGHGPDCTLFKPGEAVYYAGSVIRPGANCQFHLVDERIVGRKPENLSFAEAAALPLTTLTAWELMFERMGISKAGAHAGRSVLVLGGAGGVGSIAIQLAKKLARLKVIASASRPATVAWCKDLGADATVDHAQPLPEQLKLLGEAEVDYVLCFSGTDAYWSLFPRLVKPQGKVGLIVRTTKPVDLAILHDKSIEVCLEGMFTRSTFHTPDMDAQHALLDDAAGLIEAGVLKTTLAQNLGKIGAASLRRAHKMLEEGHVIGKLVLEGW